MARTTVGLLVAFAALALAQDPCANPANICCNPTVRAPHSSLAGEGDGGWGGLTLGAPQARPEQKCPGDLVCPNCGKKDCVCPPAPPAPPPGPPEPRPPSPAELGAACLPCKDEPWNNTNLEGHMGDGCDVNATLTHVGERLKGPASICCAACLNTTGCTGFTWCATTPPPSAAAALEAPH